MNREIKFRAKRVGTKEWVYGTPQQDEEGILSCIVSFEPDRILEPFRDYNLTWYDVIPETIGQFTGLTDKNGVEIYEGDLIVPRFIHDSNTIGQVIFNNGTFLFQRLTKEKETTRLYDPMISLEVIGNIYEEKQNELESN